MPYQNILLIDDDVEDQGIFRDALETVSDALVFTAFTNAKEALGKLMLNELKPDVIFLDLNMPVMSGKEFLIEIKKQDAIKHILVIIFTTSSSSATMESTKELGAIDFITKPNRFDTLVSVLKPVFTQNL